MIRCLVEALVKGYIAFFISNCPPACFNPNKFSFLSAYTGKVSERLFKPQDICTKFNIGEEALCVRSEAFTITGLR
jgi:hypothetical protein